MRSHPFGSVVITMAGAGRRFADAGYQGPKYQLLAHGETLWWWSMIGLSHLFSTARFVFVARAEDSSRAFLQAECRRLGIRSHEVIELDHSTDGQATTALRALTACDESAPLSIFNIDTHVRPGSLGAVPEESDGWIPCFAGRGDHWSFVRLGPEGRAVEVREKQRIAPHATIGFYWFSSARLFRAAYDAFYGSNHPARPPGEAYVAPIYNHLIGAGLSVRISMIPDDAVTVLGTPEELARFQQAPAPSMPRIAEFRSPAG